VLEVFPDKRAELERHLELLDVPADIERRRELLIQCLHRAQSIFGHLPLEVQLLVGRRLGLQQSDVYGVVSFYSYFVEEPAGKYRISVCTGTACFVKGADRILDELKRHLKIGLEETSPDGLFSISSVRCVGACSLAPVVTVNDRVYANVTTKMVQSIIKDCVAKERIPHDAQQPASTR
jgi:NADH:ubiquinone oxidoreductase subunit E